MASRGDSALEQPTKKHKGCQYFLTAPEIPQGLLNGIFHYIVLQRQNEVDKLLHAASNNDKRLNQVTKTNAQKVKEAEEQRLKAKLTIQDHTSQVATLEERKQKLFKQLKAALVEEQRRKQSEKAEQTGPDSPIVKKEASFLNVTTQRRYEEPREDWNTYRDRDRRSNKPERPIEMMRRNDRLGFERPPRPGGPLSTGERLHERGAPDRMAEMPPMDRMVDHGMPPERPLHDHRNPDRVMEKPRLHDRGPERVHDRRRMPVKEWRNARSSLRGGRRYDVERMHMGSPLPPGREPPTSERDEMLGGNGHPDGYAPRRRAYNPDGPPPRDNDYFRRDFTINDDHARGEGELSNDGTTERGERRAPSQEPGSFGDDMDRNPGDIAGEHRPEFFEGNIRHHRGHGGMRDFSPSPAQRGRPHRLAPPMPRYNPNGEFHQSPQLHRFGNGNGNGGGQFRDRPPSYFGPGNPSMDKRARVGRG